jgi:hypothetical protein
MSRGFPSMTALLGLLALAGYQHRDKDRRNPWAVRVVEVDLPGVYD